MEVRKEITHAMVVRVLKAARKRVKQGWTQGHYARDWGGKPAVTSSVDACQWCLAGALKRGCIDVGTEEGMGDKSVLLGRVAYVCDRFMRTRFADGMIVWNDQTGRKKSEVLALLDDMIVRQSAREAR